MADRKDERDIAQRIADALQRTATPQPMPGAKPVPEDETVIGEVPEHLRHLHNLLVEVGTEAEEAHRRSIRARQRHMLVQAVFAESLKGYLPKLDESCDGYRLCEGWQVTGYVEDDSSGHSGFGALATDPTDGRFH